MILLKDILENVTGFGAAGNDYEKVLDTIGYIFLFYGILGIFMALFNYLALSFWTSV